MKNYLFLTIALKSVIFHHFHLLHICTLIFLFQEENFLEYWKTNTTAPKSSSESKINKLILSISLNKIKKKVRINKQH